jgi:eukaryotic-like serine/threonine-protein kinase
MLSPGERLGKYEILSHLGSGGMGEVYRARDPQLGRDVAIKILPAGAAEDPDRRQRFEREARAIAALNHPHICQIHDIGPGYIVLEYVNGDPPRGPLPPGEAVQLALQISGALAAAHGKGILHRDVKPANILVTPEGQAKLLDFGLAQSMAPEDAGRTLDGTIAGTPAYMSPEQAAGKPLDVRSDIFSFGAVLYEILSGRRAFAGASAAQVVSAVLRDDPPPLETKARLEGIVRKCLAKRPEERFQTMDDVRSALEEGPAVSQALPPSIAVLPFENLSGDAENEYFSDGLAEEIINALTRVRGLKVIARTSAFAFKGKHEDVRQIARALGVTNVLEGGVRKAGRRIRVTAQLISAGDGSHVWSDRFDRELEDVFAVQDEIASAITGALQVRLSAESAPPKRRTPDLPAYEEYLKALHFSQKWTPESIGRGRACFERAIQLDAQFPLAHAEFGHLFALSTIYGLLPPREALPRLREEAQAALDIDPALPEGHAMLGLAAAMFDYDWSEAEQQFRLAMPSGAVPPRVHRYYAHYCLLPTGRFEEAAAQQTLGLRGDPLNLTARGELALCLRAAGRKAEANRELRRLLELDETFWFPYFALGVNLALDGQWGEAGELAEEAYRVAPWFKPIVGFRAAMLERNGDTAAAAALLPELQSSEGYSDLVGPAIYHLVRGDVGGAADWAEKAIDERQPAVLFFLNAHGETIRTSPRWPALARLLRLPEDAMPTLAG